MKKKLTYGVDIYQSITLKREKRTRKEKMIQDLRNLKF